MSFAAESMTYTLPKPKRWRWLFVGLLFFVVSVVSWRMISRENIVTRASRLQTGMSRAEVQRIVGWPRYITQQKLSDGQTLQGECYDGKPLIDILMEDIRATLPRKPDDFPVEVGFDWQGRAVTIRRPEP